MTILVMSGCSNHDVKRDYLKSQSSHVSTDLTPLKGASQSNAQDQTTQQACPNKLKVVRGDSLSKISAKCNIKLSALAKANQLTPPYTIHIGETLTVPKLTLRSIKPSAPITSPHSLPTQSELANSYRLTQWQWPMQQKLDHRFVRDSAGLTSLEINTFPGMGVLAVAEGEVVYVGNGIRQFGLMVMLKHPSGHISVYAHNSQLKVSEGQGVKAGQRIAISGESGLTDRAKVYVEARYKGKKIDIKKMFN